MLLLDVFAGYMIADRPPVTHVSRSVIRESPSCRDRLARLIAGAGWHGVDNRIAWAIAQRESNGQPQTVSQGAYGLMQLQASAHSDKSWWDWDTVLTARGNLRMARALFNSNGWRPWGIERVGSSWAVDARDYAGWDNSTIWSWIEEPFARYWASYPCEVAP